MSIRHKAPLAVTLLLLALVVTLYAAVQQIVVASFLDQEQQQTHRNVARAVSAIDDELAAVAAVTADWAFWDDTYTFIVDRNQGYIESNLAPTTALINHRLHVMIYLDAAGQLVHARAVELPGGTDRELPRGLLDQLRPDGPLLRDLDDDGRIGVLTLPDEELLVAAFPILTSDMEGPARGTLVFGRLLDDALVARVAEATHQQVALHQLDQQLPADAPPPGALAAGTPVVGYQGEALVSGYALLRDVAGEPALLVQITQPREVYARGRQALEYFAYVLVVVWLTGSLSILWMLDRLVLGRLTTLRDGVQQAIVRGELIARASATERDEIDDLAEAIDETVAALDDRARVLEQVARGEPLEQVLVAIAALVIQRRPGRTCAALLLRGERLRLFGAGVFPPGYSAAMEQQAVRLALGCRDQDGRWRTAAVAGPAADSTALPDQIELALAHGLRPLWSVPIRGRGGHTVGVLVAFDEGSLRPSRADMQLSEIAAALATIAVEQSQLAEQLTYQARHDSLTGLPNRLAFAEQLEQGMHAAREREQALAVLFIDLDHFKQINDTLGHPLGDSVLRELARRLATCVAERGSVARMGGDEFLMVVGPLGADASLAQIAQEVMLVLQQPISADGHTLHVTASIGVSQFPRDGQHVTVLTRRADIALYRAKARGRNTYEVFTHELDIAVRERARLEAELRRALERSELRLHYQPQVDLRGAPVGLEALLRWQHPQHGLVPPGEFIALAEESGLIHAIGEWVLREACRQIACWGVELAHSPRVAVNISAVQFGRPGFSEVVRRVLDDTGAPADCLELELTESTVMNDVDAAVATLRELKAMGVHIAIDDFGTGYSSLSYLQRLPIDTIKIDRSFTRGVGSEGQEASNNRAILSAITALAHALGVGVVAEGVETELQLEFLREIGCDWMQGYLFSAPIAPGLLKHWLHQMPALSRPRPALLDLAERPRSRADRQPA